MQKFNYTITIESPSKEIADMLMEHICKENIGLLEMLSGMGIPKKTQMPEQPKADEKEKFLNGIRQVETVIQIITQCMLDETALDRIAAVLGINVKPQTAKQ